MPSNNKQELLTRLTDITQDIIFAKKQQLKIVYYVLLLFAAIIVISHQVCSIHPFFKWTLYSIVGLIALSTIVHQLYNKFVIRRYRDHARIIDDLLGSGVKNHINNLSKYRDPSPIKQCIVSWLYTGLYILLTVVSAVIVGYIINLK